MTTYTLSGYYITTQYDWQTDTFTDIGFQQSNLTLVTSDNYEMTFNFVSPDDGGGANVSVDDSQGVLYDVLLDGSSVFDENVDTGVASVTFDNADPASVLDLWFTDRYDQANDIDYDFYLPLTRDLGVNSLSEWVAMQNHFTSISGTLPAPFTLGSAFSPSDLATLSSVTEADSIDMSGSTVGVNIDLGIGPDTLIGSDFTDTLSGGDGGDRISGRGGNDVIFGGATAADRSDVIYGGDGNDSIDGGYGNDDLYGGTGNDTILGNYGSDTLIGNEGDDQLDGGVNADVLFGNDGNDLFNGGFANDRYVGGAGADTFFHTGSAQFATDWIQDYSAAEGDVLKFGGTANLNNFQVNFGATAAGDNAVDEAFVVYRPTGQVLWALVDGAGQDHINIMISGVEHDLLA